ncbi:MAG: DUF3568 family protein [Candidatus Omnitrophica bacterium]|nr:DUF3568 family protein [Candidatus Omnitrophota bacterium]
MNLKFKIIIFLASLSSITLCGCSTVKELSKGALGVSTKVLEEGRKDAIKKDFNRDYDTCYKTTIDSLNKISAYIYADEPSKNMIAIYVTETDTTPVGIFFKSINKDNTTIEVSSPSIYARELISGKIFLGMEGKLKDEKGKNEEPKKSLFE